MTANGPIVVYRDRIGKETEIRDIGIVRYVNGRWTQPSVLYEDKWEINGCPVNGPRVDAKGEAVAVAWFTAAEGVSQVKLVFSQDNGQTFGEAIRIDEGNPLGRVDVLLLDKETAMISWLESTEEMAKILTARVKANGEVISKHLISETDHSRASGFPQMTPADEGIVFAWTVADSIPYIKTAILQ